MSSQQLLSASCVRDVCPRGVRLSLPRGASFLDLFIATATAKAIACLGLPFQGIGRLYPRRFGLPPVEGRKRFGGKPVHFMQQVPMADYDEEEEDKDDVLGRRHQTAKPRTSGHVARAQAWPSGVLFFVLFCATRCPQVFLSIVWHKATRLPNSTKDCCFRPHVTCVR